jgi:hypothetical protein
MSSKRRESGVSTFVTSLIAVPPEAAAQPILRTHVRKFVAVSLLISAMMNAAIFQADRGGH